MSSRFELARELRELHNKWMFLGASALEEREENIVKYVVHCVLEVVSRADEGVCTPRTRGAEYAQT